MPMQSRPHRHYFYPRPPRGGRLGGGQFYATTDQFLSTPSARRATVSASSTSTAPPNFYPRPPRGGRLPAQQFRTVCQKFLSTPSARRATRSSGHPLDLFEFLSTPSARRATCRCTLQPGLFRFLSTPSARRATWSQNSLFIFKKYFYPRPPRGGRQWHQYGASVHQSISIHALREEGDPTHRRMNPPPSYF